MNRYDFNSLEKKWRKIWEENPINPTNTNKPKYYCLDMFPYPSGNGLHVGHWRGYVLSDVISRYKVLQGYEVLHPMGWDAFGLPAENYAIKTGTHPSVATEQSISNVKRQLKEISAIYDWDKEINTTDPNYYKWTQWIFLKMFENGLAYEKEMPLNWCSSCKAVLANEEATNGECDRCGSQVTKKNLRQWMLRITNYAERLLNDLDKLDWPEKVKKMQSDWIGKSYGAEIDFEIDGKDRKIKVFTTRPDTLYGACFMVLAPEHSIIKDIVTDEQKEAVEQYIFEASTKSSVDRMTEKEKTGVFTGAYGINPLNNKKLPIWISDYVLADYGTGAIMCVPAHDERDFAFAKKFDLPIVQVIKKADEDLKDTMEEAFLDEGIMVNSDKFDGVKSSEAKELIASFLEEQKIGKKTVNYKLRDWVFSRQRYWGEPIPLVHCDKCGIVGVKEEDLPVKLPNVSSYQPTSTGESPLAAIEEWVNTSCPKCGGSAKRETNTMPQWAGSSWYFLRYCDVNNDKELASKEALKKWLPVDMYVGGIEHAVLHLLYARFYTKFLKDIGVVDFDEPFLHLFNQGMITKDGAKMSKSKGNVVSPDELVEKYGCDSLRLYELFVGPPEIDCEWDDSGIDGTFRYLNKVWKFVDEYKDKIVEPSDEMVKLRHKMVYEITNRLEALTLNTVVSGFMEFTNKIVAEAKNIGGVDKDTLETIITLLAPFTPHICEELWQMIGYTESVFKNKWCTYDEEKMKDSTIEIALQINGKLKGSLKIEADANKEDVLALAKESLSDKLDGFTIVKEVYVPNRIVNIVVK
ncbi:leucine--tRNA ligase [uncultured Tyzzerella sp.]|uniref:leucine--tRNA ligase n=1 Tax=uncultured Tyzzerella sp. TaxID=2321398 RepID=UPI0029439D37|nr:leucine--tRNA ligase [uncultured Tyzzerella sp.]